MRLAFSPAARADLLEIALYIATADPVRALSFVDELEDACAMLTDYPQSGRARPELGKGGALSTLPPLRHLLSRARRFRAR
jgi:toxin ParE1/3/4